jgi:hypothetical protein
VLLEAIDEYNNPQEAQHLEAIVEDIIPEPVVEGSRQQEAKKSSLPVAYIGGQKLEAVEEDHEVETSTRASRETPTSQIDSQSSHPSLQYIKAFFNNIGSGIMINRNIGNTYNATITNVGNNNSVNHHHTNK